MASVSSGANQMNRGQTPGVKGTRRKGKSRVGWGLFTDLAVRVGIMGIFVGIWYWTGTGTGNTSLFLSVFWL